MTSFVHDVVLFFSTTVGKSRDWPFHDFNSCNPFRFCFRSQMNSKVNVVLSIEVVLSEASYTWYKCTQNITLDYKHRNSVWLFSPKSHICLFCIMCGWWRGGGGILVGNYWSFLASNFALPLIYIESLKIFLRAYIRGSIKK